MEATKKAINKAESRLNRDDPWPAALRILSRRDFSTAELRKRLNDKGYHPEPVEAALQRCQELGYLDDGRFAVNRATSLMNQGRAVGPRILQDLRQRGVSEDLAEQALAKARESLDEESLLADLLARRFPEFNFNSAPAKEKRRVINFLQRRGFAIGRIMEHLTRKGFATDDEDR